MKPAESSEIVAALVDAYPAAKIGAGTIAVYATALGDLDAREARESVARVVASSRWFPTIAEIRDSYFDARFRFPTSEAATLELRANVQRAGQYSGLAKWSHPILAAAADSVGWWRLANGDNPSADHAQFLAAYASLRKAAIVEASLLSAGIPPAAAPLPFGNGAPGLDAGKADDTRFDDLVDGIGRLP